MKKKIVSVLVILLVTLATFFFMLSNIKVKASPGNGEA